MSRCVAGMIKKSLNKKWNLKPASFGDLPDNFHFPQSGIMVTVPGTVHTDLYQAHLIDDPFYADNESKLQWIHKMDWIYRTEFDLPDSFIPDNPIFLVCEGLDTITEISLNGKLLLKTKNMFRIYRLDISEFIKTGKNRLKVYFRSPTRYGQLQEKKYGKMKAALTTERVYIRKAQYAFGWDWGPSFPTMGIWRPIYIHQPYLTWIEQVQIHTKSIQKNKANLIITAEINGKIENVSKIHISLNDHKTHNSWNFHYSKSQNTSFNLTLSDPKLWWPSGEGEAHLYYLEVKLLNASGQIIDKWNKKVGIRTISLQTRDRKKSVFRFIINGRPVFIKGANWIPAGPFLPGITSETYTNLLSYTKKAHMNMIRIWGGGIYEDDFFYHQCDENGILIWQDFMFACGAYPENEDFLENVKQEIYQTVNRLQFHPSLALWCGNNENEWVWYCENGNVKTMPGYKVFHNIIPGIIKKLDPFRPYWPTTPFGDDPNPNSPDSGNRHEWGIWSSWIDYKEVIKDRSHFISEFGFQGPANKDTLASVLPKDECHPQSRIFEFHNKQVEGNERLFRFLATQLPVVNRWDDFIYLTQLNQGLALKACIEHWRSRWPATAGTIIWQLNDCWPVTSWSLIDSHLNPKMAYFFVKNAFSSVFSYVKKKGKKLKIFLCNDTISDFSGQLKYSVIDENQGQINSEVSINIELQAKQKNQIIDIPAMTSKNQTIIITVHDNNSEVIHRNFYNTIPWKYKRLINPLVNYKLNKSPDNYCLEIQADRVAYFIDLYAFGINFSDRGFILLPGEKKKLFMSRNNTSEIDLNEIKIFNLNRYLNN